MQFKQLRIEAWKSQDFNGFEPVTSRYRCDALTNWAMKPLTLGAGHLWVLMSPWRMDVKFNIWHISYITSQNLMMLESWLECFFIQPKYKYCNFSPLRKTHKVIMFHCSENSWYRYQVFHDGGFFIKSFSKIFGFLLRRFYFQHGSLINKR